jgi:hypothetical protein
MATLTGNGWEGVVGAMFQKNTRVPKLRRFLAGLTLIMFVFRFACTLRLTCKVGFAGSCIFGRIYTSLCLIGLI